jgi:hypothetical protein
MGSKAPNNEIIKSLIINWDLLNLPHINRVKKIRKKYLIPSP